MKLDEVLHEVAEAIRAIPYLVGVPVVEEERGDVAKELALKVAQQKTAVLVGWDGAEPVKQSGETIIAKVGIVVSVFEKPVVNRKTEGAPTIGNMAREIAKALTYSQAEGMESPLFLKRIGNISAYDGKDGGTVSTDVVFETKTEL